VMVIPHSVSAAGYNRYKGSYKRDREDSITIEAQKETLHPFFLVSIINGKLRY